MANRKNISGEENEKMPVHLPGGPEIPDSMDLHDSISDEERLKPDTAYIELPEVKDIPGQEHITSAGPFGEMADVTTSSADEERLNVEEEDEDEVKIIMGTEADITREDLELLEGTFNETIDETDEDGELLNEENIRSDLDVPGSEDDDAMEDIGEEDEENNYYSLGSSDNDNLNEGTP